MDKIEKIRNELERRIALYSGWSNETVHPTRIDEDKQLLSFLDTLEEEPAPNGYDEAYLNEKIAKASKTWDGVDVDKYMDEVRGKEPDKGLEEVILEYDTQKYTPSPSVGIEDVARVQFASHAKVFDKKRKAVFDWEQFKEVAGIFYGFGKKDSSETKEKEQLASEGLKEAAEEYIRKETLLELIKEESKFWDDGEMIFRELIDKLNEM